MKISGYSMVLAGVLGGAILLFGSAPAAATTLPGITVAVPVDVGIAEQVYQHLGKDQPRNYDRKYRSRQYDSRDYRSRRYDSRKHGSRHKSRRHGFDLYYDGFYYAQPWWVGPGFGIGVTVPEYSAGPHVSLPFAHVQWCESRYRTYHRPSNTYVPRIGVRAQCSSPFWAAPW